MRNRGNSAHGCCSILNNFNAWNFVDEVGDFLIKFVDNAMFSLDLEMEDNFLRAVLAHLFAMLGDMSTTLHGCKGEEGKSTEV